MSKRILFMGSPEFAIPSLKALMDDYQVVGVVTQPDRPAGRGNVLTPPPVKILASEAGMPVIQPNRMKDPGVFEQLTDWKPDVMIVVAFGQILRQNVLDLAPYGCINVHASLLPRWRGAAPIQAAILAGDDQTGVTIMKLDKGIDTGPVLSQTRIPLDDRIATPELSEILAEAGAKLLLETLPEYLAGKLQPIPQEDSGACYASMLKKEDAAVDFTKPAVEISRRIRAFSPWPGSQFQWGDRQIKIIKAHPVLKPSVKPGEHQIIEGYPAIGTGEGSIVIDSIQIPGRKPMDGKAYLNGVQNWMG
jgi:methionyl-tRNA formyltransferase